MLFGNDMVVRPIQPLKQNELILVILLGMLIEDNSLHWENPSREVTMYETSSTFISLGIIISPEYLGHPDTTLAVCASLFKT